jgi:DNA primase
LISPSTIERIRNAAHIEDIVSKYVTLRRAGSSYRGLCPFHDDSTPSFYVSPSRGICKCFACGEGGDVVHFIMKIEQLNYYEALKFLAGKYGIEVEEREMTDEERRTQSERESMFVVNEWASNYFHDVLLNTDEGKSIGQAYFRSRGFRDDIIEKFRLGFSPTASDAMAKTALKEGYKDEYLVKTGLVIKKDNGTYYDKYHGRVIFPWFGITGKIVGFGGRVLDSRTKGVVQKYINSSESEIYHKAKELYGLYQAKKEISKLDNVFMVEGYTDVISMHQCGIENVVANSGTALSVDQANILRRFTNNITLLYDGDAAGQKAALRGTDILLSRGMRIKILLLPDNDDPDSFARKHTAAEFKEYVNTHQVDFITFKTNLLMAEAKNDPSKMSDLIRSIVESIAVVPEEIERSVYVHRCSEMLKVDERLLLRQIKRRREYNAEQRQVEKEREEQRKQFLNGDAPDEGAEQGDATAASAPAEPEQPAMLVESTLTEEERRFQQMEQIIMQTIVRSGEQMLSFNGGQSDEQTVSIIDYIANELKVDGLTFRTPLYARMLDAVTNAEQQGGFSASQFFLNSSDEEFSREAFRLLSDRYMLSRKDEGKADAVVASDISKMLVEYKNVVVANAVNEIVKQLADPSIANDSERLTGLLQEQMRLMNIKKKLAKMLGQRVVS